MPVPVEGGSGRVEGADHDQATAAGLGGESCAAEGVDEHLCELSDGNSNANQIG